MWAKQSPAGSSDVETSSLRMYGAPVPGDVRWRLRHDPATAGAYGALRSMVWGDLPALFAGPIVHEMSILAVACTARQSSSSVLARVGRWREQVRRLLEHAGALLLRDVPASGSVAIFGGGGEREGALRALGVAVSARQAADRLGLLDEPAVRIGFGCNTGPLAFERPSASAPPEDSTARGGAFRLAVALAKAASTGRVLASTATHRLCRGSGAGFAAVPVGGEGRLIATAFEIEPREPQPACPAPAPNQAARDALRSELDGDLRGAARMYRVALDACTPENAPADGISPWTLAMRLGEILEWLGERSAADAYALARSLARDPLQSAIAAVRGARVAAHRRMLDRSMTLLDESRRLAPTRDVPELAAELAAVDAVIAGAREQPDALARCLAAVSRARVARRDDLAMLAACTMLQTEAGQRDDTSVGVLVAHWCEGGVEPCSLRPYLALMHHAASPYRLGLASGILVRRYARAVVRLADCIYGGPHA